MAITQAHLTDSSSGTPGHGFTMGAFTPSASKLQLVSVYMFTSFGSLPYTGTLSSGGTGLNFVDVIGSPVTVGGVLQCWVFRAMKSGGLGSGTPAFSVGSASGDVWIWSVDEFDGVDTSGTDGAGAVLQSASGTQTNVGTNNPATATLGAFSSVNNGTYLAGGVRDGSGLLSNMTTPSGFTNIIDTLIGPGRYESLVAWRADNNLSNSITPNSAGGAPSVIAIALELAAGGAAPADTFAAAWSSQGTLLTRGRPSMVASGANPSPRLP